jgi:hypothetical protein
LPQNPSDFLPFHERLHQEKMTLLREIQTWFRKTFEIRPPQDKTVGISASNPYIVDYQGRKHVFIWFPSTATTLSFEDFGTGTVQPQVWTNLGMPEGLRVLAPNNSTPVIMMVRCSDEVIP